MAEFRKYAVELDSSTALTHKKSNLDPVGFSAAVAKEHVRGVGRGVLRGAFADPPHPTQRAPSSSPHAERFQGRARAVIECDGEASSSVQPGPEPHQERAHDVLYDVDERHPTAPLLHHDHGFRGLPAAVGHSQVR